MSKVQVVQDDCQFHVILFDNETQTYDSSEDDTDVCECGKCKLRAPCRSPSVRRVVLDTVLVVQGHGILMIVMIPGFVLSTCLGTGC